MAGERETSARAEASGAATSQRAQVRERADLKWRFIEWLLRDSMRQNVYMILRGVASGFNCSV
jgi:hypothetical protein